MPGLIHDNGEAAQQFVAALSEGTPQEQATALLAWQQQIQDGIRADFEAYEASRDTAVLAQRGIRQLTSQETKFYAGLVEAMKSATPKQAFADFLGTDDGMPETILTDVFKNIEASHKLLDFIDFEYVGYRTKVLKNKNRVALAVWGTITDSITAEMKASFETADIRQNRLTAFSVIPRDILDMGYQWIDALIRRTLEQAIYDGLENGLVNGRGVNSWPVGFVCDVHHGVSFNTSTGYPLKTPVFLLNLGTDYMAKTAAMAKTEAWTETEGSETVSFGGKPRAVPMIGFIANTATMWKRVNPARLAFDGNGNQYLANPVVPTEFIPCESVEDDKAILLVKGCYGAKVGGTRNGSIEFSDDFKFLDDCRTFKIMQHCDGIADDDTCIVYVDVSNLERESIPVHVSGSVTTVTETA